MAEPICGVVLAGGLARRMGGGDKPLRTVGRKAILARIIDRLGPQCTRLLLNANGDPGRFASSGLPVVADTLPGFAGPLAGLLASLEWLASNDPALRWAVSVPGDTPFIPTDLVLRLQAARVGAGAKIAYATSGGRAHPVIGLWPVSLGRDLRTYLVHEGQHKVGGFTARFAGVEVEWPTVPYDPFFNANAPQDIDEADEIARQIDTLDQ